jgi:hypothetical protein
LKRAGLFYRKIKKIEKLTKRHKQLRVEYSNEMKGYAWRTILFSDEKTFQLGSGPEYAWQMPANPITREYVTHAPKLHVWGAIGAHMKSNLFFFQENLNSELYQKILKRCITEDRLIFGPKQKTKLRGKWQFLQDNSRVHKAKNSMKVLDTLVGDRIISHPPRSPDLNPIEDMWSYLDRQVKASRVTTIQGLKSVLTKAWKNLPWTEIQKSVDSMEKRIQLCRESGGNRIQY